MAGVILKMASALALTCAAPAMATQFVINTTGSTPDNGIYGNALTFSGTNGASTINVRVTGWQVRQQDNVVSAAYVGAYGPGLGVTGIGDLNGNFGFHQIDNAGGYNDFVLLQFDQAVYLGTLNLNSYTLGALPTKDNDLGFAAVNYGGATWNSNLDLAGGVFVPSSLTAANGTGANGIRPTPTMLFSRQWLVSSAFASGNNDGFKLASITVTAVPEPVTWAMMIVGFGAVGMSLRMAKRRSDREFDAKIKQIPEGAAA